MIWLFILLGVLLLYLALFFVVAPLTIPFLRREELSKRTPSQISDATKMLEKDASSPYEFLKSCYEYVLSTNSGARFDVFREPKRLFERDARVLWKRSGFMHATQLNHLLRLMLANSSYFSDEAIRLKRTFLNFGVHQYMQVRIAGQWYDVDLAAASLGTPLGKHAWGFR